MAPEVKTSCNEDIISSLPDDILHQLLIRLDIKTAFRTGILSRRWKHLSAMLNHCRLILETKISHRSPWRRNARLLAFLNNFLAVANPQTHPPPTSLVVEFDYFRRANEKLLQQCIKVALSGKLEHLMLWNKSAYYEFPLSSLSDEHGNSLQSLAISNCYTSRPHGFRIFHSLQKLVLYNFRLYEPGEIDNLVEERFQLLLTSCSSLEVLSIENSFICPILKINTPNQLKELTIDHCYTHAIEIMHAHKLEKLEIMKRNGCSLPGCCKLSMATLPCAKHFHLVFDYCRACSKESSGYKLENLSRAAPSLETLIISLQNQVWFDQTSSDVLFCKLRHLIVEAQTSRPAVIFSPYWISVLLESAPFLETLEINIREQEHGYTHRPPPSDFSHINLKELKVKGFHEESMEIEMDLILFILERATSLERIIIIRDGTHAKQWFMKEKNKILDCLPVGEGSNPLITFT